MSARRTRIPCHAAVPWWLLLAALGGIAASAACSGDSAGSASFDGTAGDGSGADASDVDATSDVGLGAGDAATLDTGDAAAASCTLDSDCAKDDPCVVAVCGTAGQCVVTPLTGKACDDGNACTTADQCDETGACAGTAEVELPSDPCAVCSCDAKLGITCLPKAPGALCDDGDCCTEDDACAPCVEGEPGCGARGLVCHGAAPSCDDDNPCTEDACACAAGAPSCAHPAVPDGAACIYNPSICTTGDQCTGGQCVPGPPAPLGDDNPCTQDLCVKGIVEHQPLAEGQCDDGDECTTADHCFLGSCIGGPPVECEVSFCAGSAACIPGQGCVQSWLPVGAVCAGDDACGAGFACTADHTCAPAEGKSCDDGDACTTDTCVPASGACVHEPLAGACDGLGPCASPQCNPLTGACDIPLPDGTPCPEGVCMGGACACLPDCTGASCGDDGCGGSCGTCAAGLSCLAGECVGCGAGCPTVCLPDGTCCPPGGFCPQADTTLSGAHSFELVYIPPGVTVTCTGSSPLVLDVAGNVWIEGALRADGMAGTSNSGANTTGICGGFAGGDGFRSCTSSATTFCETSAASVQECTSWLSPKESFAGPVCAYLATAPGQPGFGPGGGFGGKMAHPIHNGAPGSAGGGGGGSYVTPGQPGAAGSTICGTNPSGGNAGPVNSPSIGLPLGGSGGGAGGLTRNGDCGLACPLGCTAWGGDGGAGGGVIAITAGGTITVPGTISARGGDGGTSGGATCGGSGGGGSGGVLELTAPTITTPLPQAAHLVATGGAGGAPKCPGIGAGGAGGTGAVLLSAP